jgi:hypothetical protein
LEVRFVSFHGTNNSSSSFSFSLSSCSWKSNSSCNSNPLWLFSWSDSLVGNWQQIQSVSVVNQNATQKRGQKC